MRILASLASLFGSGRRRAAAMGWTGATLLAAAVALDGCQPSGDLSCADGVPCGDGQVCVASPDSDQGMCVAACKSSASCADATPLCDAGQQICRACFPGEDAACSARDPSRPRCGGGRCVQCLSPQTGSAQAA